MQHVCLNSVTVLIVGEVRVDDSGAIQDTIQV